MTNIEQEAIELTEFVKRYVPSGWMESIQTVCSGHYFMWYEMEAIKAWTQRKDAKKKAERPIRFFCAVCGKEIWQELDYEEHDTTTLGGLLRSLKCSDCILNEIRKEGAKIFKLEEIEDY